MKYAIVGTGGRATSTVLALPRDMALNVA